MKNLVVLSFFKLVEGTAAGVSYGAVAVSKIAAVLYERHASNLDSSFLKIDGSTPSSVDMREYN